MKILFNVFLIIIFCACNNTNTGEYKSDSVVWKITDFEEKKSIILKPDSTKTYAALVIKVLGNTEDTIKIKRDKGFYDIILSGQIDTIIRQDYYGNNISYYFEFDPYMSKNGSLQINIDMY